MLRKSNLQLVEAPAFFRREQPIFSTGTEADAHSLHQLVPMPARVHPDFVSFFIEKYSRKDDIVLDPFCGTGAVGLELALAGRIPFLSDNSELMLRIARAKLEPADITEVTLALQQINSKRPIDATAFAKYFGSFFDIQTFQEICNLKDGVAERADRITRFVEAVLFGVLHGNSAGFLSSYTNPLQALSPVEQDQQNYTRRQRPDYRPVSPRVLRKTALLLRDGTPSVLLRSSSKKKIALADARDLSFVRGGEAGLILTNPPLPGEDSSFQSQWLRHWAAGISDNGVKGAEFLSLTQWLDFMNAVLVELARVTRFGVRAVLLLPEEFSVRASADSQPTLSTPEKVLIDMVESELGFFWQAEGSWVNMRKSNAVAQNFRSSSARRQEERSVALVLRRR